MRSLIIPSYPQGFARYADQSEAPELWRGLVGAWLPFLGPTGLTLHDVLGRNSGTLTNMDPATAWVATVDKWGNPIYALDFDGTNEQIIVAHSPSIGSEVQNGLTVSMWFNSDVALSATGSAYRMLEKGDCYMFLQGTASAGHQGGMYFTVKRSGVTYRAHIGIALNAAQWYYIVGTFDGQTANTYIDGKLLGTVAVGGQIDDDGLS